MNPREETPPAYSCPFRSDELDTQDFLKEIETALSQDNYYDGSKGGFPELAYKTGLFIRSFLFHDLDRYFVSNYGDRVFFGPDNRHIEREGVRTAAIKYAAHFVTSSTPRSLDNQKVRNLSFIPQTITAGKKYLTKDSRGEFKIHFVLEIDIKNNIVVICDGVMDAAGNIRIITYLPEQKRARIAKKIASREYQEARKPQQSAAESTQLPSLESSNSGSLPNDSAI